MKFIVQDEQPLTAVENERFCLLIKHIRKYFSATSLPELNISLQTRITSVKMLQ